jgi:hypothetical protein
VTGAGAGAASGQQTALAASCTADSTV